MIPSAPDRHAADRQRLDQPALAGGVRRVDDDRQVGQVVEHRDRGQVERVAGEGLERPDAPLAQDDVRVAGRLTMYSAAISHSSIVAPKPRLSITGRLARPPASSSEKFCMLRAPTWRMSAYSATMSTWLGSMTSVMTGRPVRSRASAR